MMRLFPPSRLVPLFAVLASTSSFAAEPLSPEDRKELETLYNNFQNDTRIGKQTNYPDFIEQVSLTKLMTEHRSFLGVLLKMMSEEQLGQMMTFTPDLETVLQERDPKKYFNSIGPGKTMKDMAAAANIVTKVVATGGDREKAYVVAEGQFKGDLGTTEPYYSVWPALRTEKGWRLDATSNLVRDLRIKVKDMKKSLPAGK